MLYVNSSNSYYGSYWMHYIYNFNEIITKRDEGDISILKEFIT